MQIWRLLPVGVLVFVALGGHALAGNGGADAEAALRQQFPCRYDPKAREFDFWVGEFQVRDAEGNVLGDNVIAKAQGDCVLVENWTSARGGTGMSMNFFDPTRGQWRQVWVSPGLIIDIAGGLESDSMVLQGYAYYHGTGERRPFRGTWTPLEDGVVRQFFEESPDGGETFAPWFEGFYHPVGPGRAGSPSEAPRG